MLLEFWGALVVATQFWGDFEAFCLFPCPFCHTQLLDGCPVILALCAGKEQRVVNLQLEHLVCWSDISLFSVNILTKASSFYLCWQVSIVTLKLR